MSIDDFNNVVQVYAEKRVVVFSTSKWDVQQVFQGDVWCRPSLLGPLWPTDDSHTIWILQDHRSSMFYLIRSVSGMLREVKGNSGQH